MASVLVSKQPTRKSSFDKFDSHEKLEKNYASSLLQNLMYFFRVNPPDLKMRLQFCSKRYQCVRLRLKKSSVKALLSTCLVYNRDWGFNLFIICKKNLPWRSIILKRIQIAIMVCGWAFWQLFISNFNKRFLHNLHPIWPKPFEQKKPDRQKQQCNKNRRRLVSVFYELSFRRGKK